MEQQIFAHPVEVWPVLLPDSKFFEAPTVTLRRHGWTSRLAGWAQPVLGPAFTAAGRPQGGRRLAALWRWSRLHCDNTA